MCDEYLTVYKHNLQTQVPREDNLVVLVKWHDSLEPVNSAVGFTSNTGLWEVFCSTVFTIWIQITILHYKKDREEIIMLCKS